MQPGVGFQGRQAGNKCGANNTSIGVRTGVRTTCGGRGKLKRSSEHLGFEKPTPSAGEWRGLVSERDGGERPDVLLPPPPPPTPSATSRAAALELVIGASGVAGA